jgi:hypothetical protein
MDTCKDIDRYGLGHSLGYDQGQGHATTIDGARNKENGNRHRYGNDITRTTDTKRHRDTNTEMYSM